MRRLQLTRSQVKEMRTHVDSCVPLEACGLLAGTRDAVQEVLPVTNQAGSTVRFRMDPMEQLQAFDRMSSSGLDLLGIYHSHPAGPDGPSPTDIAEAAYTVIQVIWSHEQGVWRVHGYWIEKGLTSEVELLTAGGT